MTYIVVSFTHLSANPDPSAGQQFTLKVKLDHPVEQQDTKVVINLEKQRILMGIGGAPELRPTGTDYFEQQNTGGSIESDLGPIVIQAGKDEGATGPIVVRKDAKANGNDPRVEFPEQLLFTAFFGGSPPSKKLFRCHPVSILPAGS